MSNHYYLLPLDQRRQTISRFKVDDAGKPSFHSREIIPAGSFTIAELLFMAVIKNIFPEALDDLYLFDADAFANWLLKVRFVSQIRTMH
jgi:hypothetical protein